MAAAGAGGGGGAQSTAYLIMGHGAEGELSKDTVPPGCTLIVGVHAGEISYLDSTADFDKFISDPNQDKFLNPVQNYKEIIRRYGSVAIYRSGERYPNFKYKLIFYWKQSPAESGPSPKIHIRLSGIMEWPFNEVSEENIDNVVGGLVFPAHAPFISVRSDFESLYSQSVWPKKEMIIDSLEEVRKALSFNGEVNLKDVTLEDFINANEESTYFQITQRELFDMVRHGMLRPGAFYNFVCRDTPSEVLLSRNQQKNVIAPERRLELFSKHNERTRENYFRALNLAVQRGKKIYNVAYPLPRVPNSAERRILLSQIAEAEQHRRPYIRETPITAPAELSSRLLRELYFQKIKELSESELPRNEKGTKIKEIINGLKRNGLQLSGFIEGTVSPISEAVSYENYDLAKLLIDAGASLDEYEFQNVGYDLNNRHPGGLIHYAAINYDLEMLEFLLDNNADINVRSPEGMTALYFAVFQPMYDLTLPLRIINLLLSRKANPDLQDNKGVAPIHFIKRDVKGPILKALLDAGADPNIQDNRGDTALMNLASTDTNVDLVRLLLERGANPEIKNKDGDTALDFAVYNGASDIEELLRAGAGAGAGSKGGRRRTRRRRKRSLRR